MNLTRLVITEFPGFTEPREYTFTERITLITGPNASGKSSTARAFLALFAPHLHRDELVSVVGEFTDGTHTYVARRLNDSITWERDGRRFKPPWTFTRQDFGAQYFTVQNLLAPSEVDDDLVKHVLVELTGGVDLAGITATSRQSNRLRGQNEADELRRARADLAKLQGERNQLYQYEQALGREREQLRELGSQLAQGAVLQTVQQFHATTRELTEHELKRTEHAGVYEQLTPDRVETVRGQLARVRAEQQRLRDLATRSSQLEAALHGVPHIAEAETLLLTAIDAEEQLTELRQHYAHVAAQLVAHQERLAEEQAATGVRAQPGEYPNPAALQRAYDLAARTRELEAQIRAEHATVAGNAARVREAGLTAQQLRETEQRAATEHAEQEAKERRRTRTTVLLSAGVAVASVAAAITDLLDGYEVFSIPLRTVAYAVAAGAMLLTPIRARIVRRKRAARQAALVEHAERAAAARAEAQAQAHLADEDELALLGLYTQLRHYRANAERLAGPLTEHAAKHAAQPGAYAVWLARVAELGNLAQRTAVLQSECAELVRDIAQLEAAQAERVAVFAFAAPPSRSVLLERSRNEAKWASEREQLREVRSQHGQATAAYDSAWQLVHGTLQRAGVAPQQHWQEHDIEFLVTEQEQHWEPFAQWHKRHEELLAAQALQRRSLGEEEHLLSEPATAISERLAALPVLEQQRDELQRRVSQIEVRVQEAQQHRVLERARERVQRAEQALRDHRAVTLQETALQFVYEDVMRSSFLEHEPRALERASTWFHTFTNGEFTLKYDLDPATRSEGVLFAMDTRSGAVRTLAQLSSGTISQLLLAARLAFALEREEDGKPVLPFVLDEALGTADSVRFAEIARSLELFSSETGRQLLYLSARQEDTEAWQRASAHVGVITLQEE